MASVPITRLAFWTVDPRVVVVSLDAGQAQQLGAKIYRVAPDPYKFEEAVLLGANENYYGECRFQIDPELPNYVRMDRALFGSILDKFNPSRGDFVLSKTGELLGIMVNSEYCGVLNPLTAGATIECGPNLRPQQVGQVFSQLQNRMTTLPVRLQ